jgi:hypothetical protein
MPPAAPVRPAPDLYHFHTYDFPGSVAFQASAGQPTAGGLQFYSMRRDLQGLLAIGQARNVPNITLTNVGGATARGRRTMMLSFGNQGNAPGLPTIVITGGIHAREWIATEIAYLIAEYLIVNYPVGIPANPRLNRLRNLIRTRNIHIIPMLNPDGNRRSVFGQGANDRNWRKNRRRLPYSGLAWILKLAPGGNPTPPLQNVRYVNPPVSIAAQYDVPTYNPGVAPPGGGILNTRQLPNLEIGVDLNRNQATPAWGYDCWVMVNGAMHYMFWNPAEDQFFGFRPGGERESGNVALAMANAVAAPGAGPNLDVTLDYHSYGRMILYPGEVDHAGGVDAVHQAIAQMLNVLIRNQAVPFQPYTVGDPLTVAGYDATGTLADYAAQQHQARSLTIELDPGPGLGYAGFAIGEGQIQGVFEKNIRGALAAIAAPTTVPQALNYQALYAWNTYGQGNRVP